MTCLCVAAQEARKHCHSELQLTGSPFGGASRANQEMRTESRKRKGAGIRKDFVGKKVLQEWDSPGGSTSIDYEGCVWKSTDEWPRAKRM